MGFISRFGWLIAIVVICFNSSSAAMAQTSFPLTNLQADSNFGEKLVFYADLEANLEFEAIDLVFRLVSTGNSTVLPARIDGETSVLAEYQIQPQDYIPVFSSIEYWYNIRFADGTQRQSPVESFIYQDDRFSWQHLESNDGYEIYWAEGDLAFGQAIQDALYQSTQTFSQMLDLPNPTSLNIYIYPTYASLQSALRSTKPNWVAGHANPAQNIILASIPIGFDQTLDIKRQIPHELTHIRLYQYLEENYANLPVWYNEGLASLSEFYSLPEYREILDAAWNTDELIPISNLCDSMPYQVAEAQLAYAQVDSFVRFLYNEYGKDGLQKLLDAYQDGHTCQNGVQVAFNQDLDALQKTWFQKTFNSSILPKSLNTALTWIVLLLFLLVPTIVLTYFSNRKSRKE